MVVKGGVNGIGFDWESADDGNLEVGPRSWVPLPSRFIGYRAGVGSEKPVEILSGRCELEVGPEIRGLAR